ncbi:MAG: 4Fe-4S dicluster domain-containing protein [Negativicutes bacterium]|nr:4Fe-4S dicluster domain-containing protein [Negativicutes bacterium]
MSKPEKRYAMVIDLRRCIGCNSCTVACKLENSTPEGKFRSWVIERETGEYPAVDRYNLPRLCNHCDNPPCLKACPTGATFAGEGGSILVDPKKCIGCRYCMAACPYTARFINNKVHAADKCTFCYHRVSVGLLPACVTTCVGHARFFGDLNDKASTVARLLADHKADILDPELGTKPQVFYIVPPGTSLKSVWGSKGGE